MKTLLVLCFLLLLPNAVAQIFDPSSDLCAQIISYINTSPDCVTGCTITLPAKSYFCTTQLVIPNDGATIPRQKSLRIVGSGMDSYAVLNNTPAPTSGTIIDMQANVTYGKIRSLGAGYLEISNLTLMDTQTDCKAFFFSTNTNVHIHDVSFFGSSVGASACNDGIILGGDNGTVTPEIDGTLHGAFQGYGAVIRDSFFNRIRRAFVFGQYTNAISILSNTIWNDSGGDAAMLFGSTTGSSGNYIAGNLIEVLHYNYGIANSAGSVFAWNTLSGNTCWDAGASFVSCIQLNPGAVGNKILQTNVITPAVIDLGSGNIVY